MKKYVLLFVSLLGFQKGIAQNITDALRYSITSTTGTARFRAMGGAFGALGGDFSAIGSNPASSAIFLNNQISITANNTSNNNQAYSFGTLTKSNYNSLDMNQAGIVLVFDNKNTNADWKKIAFSMNYENTNNFNNREKFRGVNPINSVANYFLENANGVELGVLDNLNFEDLFYEEQQAYLGYNAFIINPLAENNSNTGYVSNVLGGGNYYQYNESFTQGYTGKISFNAATSYKDILFLGINLNSHFTDYTQTSTFYESNNNALEASPKVTEIEFFNDVNTIGSGFSFQLGAIAKITKEIRFGLSYDSGTRFKLTDNVSQSIVAVSESATETLPADVVNPNFTIQYQPYKLKTPSKINLSTAYIFGKNGLISLDYSLKGYKNTRFLPKTNDYISEVNKDIHSVLQNSSEVRIGAEYKIKKWSLRSGYSYEQSPYKKTKLVGDLNSYSLGLGYNFGTSRLDVAYANARRNSETTLFSGGFTNGTTTNKITDALTATLLFEL